MIFLTAHLTSLGIGMAIALAILILVRKNHLMVSHAVWWLTVAAASITFGAYPRLIDQVGAMLGIHYPPVLLIIIGMGFILIKMLTMDLKRSEHERKIRALTQRLAILESRMYPTAARHQNPEICTDASLNESECSNHEADRVN
jgi:hypothetical protein